MATSLPQIALPKELHHVDNIAQLNQAMTANPQAVIDYIMYLRGENEVAQRALNDTQKELMQISCPKSSRTFEQRNMKHEQKENIATEFLNTGDLGPLVLITISASACFLPAFSNILYGILPWSSQFELIRNNCFTATMSHWITPFSFILLLFIVGYLQGFSHTKIFPTDNQKDNSRFGIKRRVAQFASNPPYPLGYLNDSEEQRTLCLTQLFADYVGNPRVGSSFSKWRTIGHGYALLVNSVMLCFFPFITWQKGGRNDVNCVGNWAKGGFYASCASVRMDCVGNRTSNEMAL